MHIDWKTSGTRGHPVWMVWPSLDSLSAITFSRLGMCQAFSHLFPGTPDQDSPQQGTQWADLMSPSFIGNYGGVACSYEYYLVQEVASELFRAK